MAFWNRNKTDNNVPAELEPYYERGGWRLWVRRIVAGIVALALLLAIFWAARAVYDRVRGNDGGSGTRQTQQENEQQNRPEDNTALPGDNRGGGDTRGGGTTSGTNTGSGTQQPGQNSQPANPTPAAPAPAPNPTAPAGGGTTNTAPSRTLPATGG